ncbi:hypothetical protein QEN19_004243 [Hanseniaspora menglaensis]
MSFQFNFEDSDLEIDETNIVQIPHQSVDSNNTTTLKSLDSNWPVDLIKAESLKLNELLSTLKDVRLTYSKFKLNSETEIIRRELYDIRHQIMSESDPTTNTEVVNLDFLDKDDLLKNVYEGGLTTWECSLDLVKYLDQTFSKNSENGKINKIIELGCGTALPSLYLLNQTFKNKVQNIDYMLCDYNEYVLRLVTLPNILINWYDEMISHAENVEIINSTQEQPENIVENEFTISAAFIDLFINYLNSNNIQINFAKGSWSNDLINIIDQNMSPENRLILTSETIYQPDTMPLLTETIMKLKENGSNNKIILATKDIYFGVGGNLVDFITLLKSKYSQSTYQIIKSDKSNRSLVMI